MSSINAAIPSSEARIMAYLLPRAVIVLIAWSVTCGIINVWSSVDPVAFYIAGVSWALVGIAFFGYVYKLRSEANLQQDHSLPHGVEPAE
jgi:hypothetical protein